MANGINPFDAFPFDKGTLETLLARGKVLDAAKRYFRRAALLLHPDQGGADFREFGLEADAVFKNLNDAYQRIENASPAQLASWIEMYWDNAHDVIRGLERRISQVEQTAQLNWQQLQDALTARNKAEIAMRRAEKDLDELTVQREGFKVDAQQYRRRAEDLEQRASLPAANEANAWLYLELAAAQCELYRYDDAALRCISAGEVVHKLTNPSKDTLTLWLEYWNGRTYEGTGDITAAAQSYERALTINNNHEPSKERLKRLRNVWFVLEDAATEINTGRYDAALVQCTLAERIIGQAFRNDPAGRDERQNWLYYWKARAFEGKRDFDAAKDLYFAASSMGNERATEALKGLQTRKSTTF